MDDLAAQNFAQSLDPEEIMLLTLRDELYDGRWDDMVADLATRLDGTPYVFKLAGRIEADLERIERLKEEDKWDEEKASVFGLPKVKVRRVRAGSTRRRNMAGEIMAEASACTFAVFPGPQRENAPNVLLPSASLMMS